MALTTPEKLTRKDFVSNQEVRWCPGCGDYSILAQIQRLLPELGVPKENIVFISGIGCASRFPYYMDTYGFHTIHGRAPTLATGLKLVNKDLQIWIVTGDGDALSIGGNHLLHALRRNLDINILLFNNRIYGLTKGQSSPTSPVGTRTKTTPQGSVDSPMEPIRFAVASRAGFVARTIDTHTKHLSEMMRRAAAYKGTSFIEIYQNCVVFNNGAFSHFADRGVRPVQTVDLKHGEKMIFGKESEKGLRFNGTSFDVVAADDPGVMVHDETEYDSTMAYGLARLRYPDYPIPIGVFRAVTTGSYQTTLADAYEKQYQEAKNKNPPNLQKLLDGPNTWTVT